MTNLTPGVAGQDAATADTAKRVTIDAPLVQGSFSLQGARIDDVILTSYRETLDAESDNIHFLKKTSSQSTLFRRIWLGQFRCRPANAISANPMGV